MEALDWLRSEFKEILAEHKCTALKVKKKPRSQKEMMMNKDAYVKTSMVYWSQEDESYICESPLFDRTLGVGDTREEAKQNFLEMLDEAIEFLKDGPIYERPGCPLKGNTNFHTKIKPTVKNNIKVLGEQLGGITAGEVLDYLVFFHNTVTRERTLNVTVDPTAHL